MRPSSKQQKTRPQITGDTLAHSEPTWGPQEAARGPVRTRSRGGGPVCAQHAQIGSVRARGPLGRPSGRRGGASRSANRWTESRAQRRNKRCHGRREWRRAHRANLSPPRAASWRLVLGGPPTTRLTMAAGSGAKRLRAQRKRPLEPTQLGADRVQWAIAGRRSAGKRLAVSELATRSTSGGGRALQQARGRPFGMIDGGGRWPRVAPLGVKIVDVRELLAAGQCRSWRRARCKRTAAPETLADHSHKANGARYSSGEAANSLREPPTRPTSSSRLVAIFIVVIRLVAPLSWPRADM